MEPHGSYPSGSKSSSRPTGYKPPPFLQRYSLRAEDIKGSIIDFGIIKALELHHILNAVKWYGPLKRLTQEKVETEEDPVVLDRRRKQISYGKELAVYKEYIGRLPKKERVPGDPSTPNLRRKYSRRAWDGAIKSWKIRLHQNHDNNIVKAVVGDDD